MKALIAILGCSVLVACSSQPGQQAVIRDRLLDYQAAYVEPTLRVPDGLSDARINEALPIPGIEEPTAGLYGGSFNAPRAETAARTIALPEARRYDVRGLQWLAIPKPIAVVWPQVEQFAVDRQIVIVSAETTSLGQRLRTGITTPDLLPSLSEPTALEFKVNQGLRMGTAEVRVESLNTPLPAETVNAILDALKEFLDRSVESTRTVSSALAQLDQVSRMVITREEGIDHLTIGAPIERVFPVAADILQDLRALIESGDLSAGTIQFQYVRKATEQRLQTMTFLNRAIATTIDDPVGQYQLAITPVSADEVRLDVLPISGSASIGGVNELIRELSGRLY